MPNPGAVSMASMTKLRALATASRKVNPWAIPVAMADASVDTIEMAGGEYRLTEEPGLCNGPEACCLHINRNLAVKAAAGARGRNSSSSNQERGWRRVWSATGGWGS